MFLLRFSIKIFFLLFISTVFSQNIKKADSLQNILKTIITSEKDKAIILRSIAYFHPDLSTSLYSAKESLRIATQINEQILQAEALEEISHIEKRIGNNSESLKASFKALKIYESLELVERQAASFNQLANNYLIEKEYRLAIDYFEKAITIYTTSNNQIQYIYTLLNLGEAYRLSGNLKKAKSSFIKVLKLNEETKDDLVTGYGLGNLGMVYTSNQQFDKAKSSLNKAIEILNPLGDTYSVSIYLAELATIYNAESNIRLAETTLIEAFTLAKTSGLKEQIRDISSSLVSHYTEQAKYKKALDYQKLYQVYQDSLINKDNIKKIEQLKSSYKINQRELEIEKINEVSTQRKNIALGLFFGILLFIILSYLLYNLNKRIRIANLNLSKRDEEKALLLKELNHRVKNNLQMISSLLNLQSRALTQDSDKEIIVSSKNRVEALSLVHRKLYQEGIETKVAVKEYVEELVLNLIYSYGTNLKPEFDIIPININVDKAIPISLIINELVTNAIKHAYEGIQNPSLKISIKQKKEILYVEIHDNGNGFSEKEREKTNSFGLKLILSLTEQLEGTIKTVNNDGTHWIITLEV